MFFAQFISHLHYKTITAIRKAKELSNSEHPVVPVFWMASEDHDFQEIRWVYGKSEKHSWQFDSNLQMVGRLGLNGLQDAFNSWVSDGLSDMLSDKEIICPTNLLNIAKKKQHIAAAIVNAGMPFPMHSAYEAVKNKLIIPIFIGDKNNIKNCCKKFMRELR